MFMLHAIVIPGVNSSWIVGVRLEEFPKYPPSSKISRNASQCVLYPALMYGPQHPVMVFVRV